MSETQSNPHVLVQWKGTDVCFDFECVCGEGGHFDGYVAYYVRCAGCGRVYRMPIELQIVEIDEGEAHLNPVVPVRDE